MPRHLPSEGPARAATAKATGAGLTAATFLLLCALTLMACVSHARWRWRRCHRSSDPVISIHQVQPGADGSTCLWQKSIIMGGKCQLPDFSGIITYDSAGNLIAPGHPRLASVPEIMQKRSLPVY